MDTILRQAIENTGISSVYMSTGVYVLETHRTKVCIAMADFGMMTLDTWPVPTGPVDLLNLESSARIRTIRRVLAVGCVHYLYSKEDMGHLKEECNEVREILDTLITKTKQR